MVILMFSKFFSANKFFSAKKFKKKSLIEDNTDIKSTAEETVDKIMDCEVMKAFNLEKTYIDYCLNNFSKFNTLNKHNEDFLKNIDQIRIENINKFQSENAKREFNEEIIKYVEYLSKKESKQYSAPKIK